MCRGDVPSGVPAPLRIIARIASCLLLGLVTTIGVAWSLSVVQPISAPLESCREPVPRHLFPGFPTNIRPWSARIERRKGAGYQLYITKLTLQLGNEWYNPKLRFNSRDLPTWTGLFSAPWRYGDAWPGNRTLRASLARGWPLPCVFSTYGSTNTLPGTLSPRGFGITINHQVRVAGSTPLPATLPYRPIPLGLTLDTLFFAWLWATLLFAPRAIRAHLRRRRNLCPQCGYPLVNLPPAALCPECGATEVSK